MKTNTLRTEQDYETALAYLETLMDAEPGSTEEAELDRVTNLVEQYEQEHYPIAPPSPAEALLFRMDQESMIPKQVL